MKYLLAGNGPIEPGEALSADCVVQFNDCRHLDRVAPGGQRLVFVSNTGTPTARSVAFLKGAQEHPVLQGAVIMQARPPAFYRVKGAALFLAGSGLWRHYELSSAVDELAGIWPITTIGFAASWRLECTMRRAGMTGWMMPSTGMIAYHWARRRMQPGDSLELIGFGWEGWEGHAWDVERRIMTSGAP